jgi:hypothetical protein
VGLDASRREGGVVRLQEHDAHNVITDVSLTLQLQQQSGMPKHEMWEEKIHYESESY